jgi:putative phosphoribosyl transferase
MMLTGMTHFVDRSDAGRQLARRLEYLRGQDIVVLGLPRGGVPVAFEVAQALTAPMDVLVIRKLGVPLRPELAFGAIGEDTPRVVNDPTVRAARLSAQEVADIERKERSELHRQMGGNGSRWPAGSR